MKRKIINIDEDKCNGCGLCVGGCHEGALQMIEGKARLISELYCDGLGACIGSCPQGAITVVEQEAKPYNEAAVMERLMPKGAATVVAHLSHLAKAGEKQWLGQGVAILKTQGAANGLNVGQTLQMLRTKMHGPEQANGNCGGGCPSAQPQSLQTNAQNNTANNNQTIAQNTPGPANWPLQLKLQQPQAGYFKGADLLLCADCVPATAPWFTAKHMSGRVVSLACPKLDNDGGAYAEKLSEIIQNGVNSITVAIMEVPCCNSLVAMAQEAIARSGRQINLNLMRISLQGQPLPTNPTMA